MKSDRSQRLGTRANKNRRRGALPRRGHTLEQLERRELLAVDAAPWHNAVNPRDVNHDLRVSPIDALLVINDLSRHGTHALATSSLAPQTAGAGGGGGSSTNPSAYLDVNGDNMVSPIDALNIINLLAVDKLAQITVVPTDLSGNVITTIPAGSDFLLKAVVQDVRTPTAQFPGVFSAYLNTSYDSALATIPQPATFSFDTFFGVARTFDVSAPGFISGAGASATSLTAPGNNPQNLWTVLVHASSAGVVAFTPSFDSTPGHDVLLYGRDDVLATNDIEFVGASLTITGTPTLSIGNVSQTEGNASTSSFVFTVTLSSSSLEQVTVAYNTTSPAAGNAASPGVDYAPTSGTLTFAPGQLTQPVTVTVAGDTTVEADEVFNVNLSSPTNATLGTSIALGTILNDDVLANLVIGDVQVTNVTSGTTTAVFTVSLSPAASSDVTVAFATANETGVAGVDYVGTSGTLTFTAGALTRTITVTILGDPLPDQTETFLVNLTNPSSNSVLQDGQARGTILPAVPIPNLSMTGSALTEGNAGDKTFTFTINLSSPASQQILVAYATVDGSATTANNDYAAASGTVTFGIGQSTALVTVQVKGDTTEEPSESFGLILTPISGTLGMVQTSATSTILNDDGPATINISDASAIGSASATTNAVFTVSLSVPVTQQVTVSYATEDNTAEANEDYLAQSGIVTFSVGGPLTQTITVPILGSPVPQADETFFVNLSSNSPGATIGDAQAVGTIIRQGITIGNVSVVEGNSGTTNALFTVNLSRAQDHVITVAFATANDTATVANGDYSPTSGTITFGIGEISKVVTVAVTGDVTVEANETFFVNLSSASGAEIFTGQATGTILNDDGQKALIELELTAPNGTPFAPGTTLDIGDDFLLRVFVQDVQADPHGIAAAYLDVLYNSNLVMVSGPITFGPLFANIQSGSTAAPGLIDEVGAFGDLAPPANPAAAQLLFSIPLKALDVGLAEFLGEGADGATHQVLEYTSDLPIPPAAINFVGTAINIGANVFTVNNVSHAEGNAGTTEYVFTVSRFLPSGETATVVYATTPGTALGGQDYVPSSGTLTFLPGDTQKQITILVNGDTTDEDNEQFFVQLSGAVGAIATESPGVATITNDDGPVAISISPTSANENSNLLFTVSLSAASGKTVTVAYTTAAALSGALATAGVDYQPTSGTLTFAPGMTQQTIAVAALPDLVADPNEVFRIVLSSPQNATLASGSAVGTIIDVPPATIAGFVFADPNDNGIKEGSEAGIANVTIRAIRADGSVAQSTTTGADGSYALVGLQPGTYTVVEVQPGFFTDGHDKHNGVESPVNDQYSGIVLAPSGLAGGYNFGELSLRPEFVSAFLNRRAFFASSILTGQFGPPISTSGLDLRTGDIWISFDGGWQGPRTLLALFDAGLGSATMTLYNNALGEVAKSTPTAAGAILTYNGVAGQPYFVRISGTNPSVSIQAVDTVSVNNVTQNEGASGTTNFVFTVSLSAPQSQQVTVNYATNPGTAAAGNDYASTNGILTFAPGETSKLVTVAVSGDTANELDETFSLVLSSATNIAIGVPAGVGTIKNDDSVGFNGSMLFSSGGGGGGGGATAPAVTPTSTSAGTDSTQTTSSSASQLETEQPLWVDDSHATDQALEEDEDWVGALLLA